MRERRHGAHSASITDDRDAFRIFVEHHRQMSDEKLCSEIRRDCARLRLRVSQRLIEQRTVHADFFRLASQPGFSGYRIIGRVFLFLRMNRQSRK